MVLDYVAEKDPTLDNVPTKVAAQIHGGDVSALLQFYEQNIKKPWRGILSGTTLLHSVTLF